MDLQSMTTAALVDAYNLISTTPLKGWKGKKTDLIDKIEELQRQLAEEEMAAKAKVSPPPPPEEARTIRDASLALLCHVEFYEDKDKPSSEDNLVPKDHPKARSVGLAYDRIISLILDEFPKAETTVACLRWYSVKVRVEEHGYEGYKLPQRRPRAKPRR